MTAEGFEQPSICKAVAQNTACYTGYWTVHYKGSVKANDLHPSSSEFKQTFSYGNLYIGREENITLEVLLYKKHSENKQQTYKRTYMRKCDFNKIANNLFSCELVTFFLNTFL